MQKPLTERERKFWLGMRQSLIIALGHIEDLLGMERSIIPKHRREQERTKTRS